MKAVICSSYGLPNVLQIQQIPKPVPNSNQVLVKIIASAINSADVKVRSLDVKWYMKTIMRIVLGISKPRKSILGTVFSGIIVDKGNKVSNFEIGDKVFGLTGFKFGTHAEYIVVNKNSNFIVMPKNASFEEAAAIVFGGQTAVYFLTKAKLYAKKNAKILIVGATGSVGLAALQIADFFKASITAVCSSKGLKIVEELGINDYIFYDKDDVFSTTKKFDIIFDAIGKTNKANYRKLLKEKGMIVSVNSGYAFETKEQLKFLKMLFENGRLKAIIDKVFTIDEIVDAHSYVDTGRKKGNVILKIIDQDHVNCVI